MRLTGHNGAVYKIIDLDQDNFLSAGGEGWIVKWEKSGNNPDGQLLAKADAQIFSMALIKNSDLLIAGCMNGDVLWINLKTNTILKKHQLSTYAIYDIIEVGDFFFTLSADGYITSWDPLRMVPIVSKSISAKALRKCIFDSESNQLIIGSSDGNLYFIDPKLDTKIHQITNAHAASIFTLAVHEGILYSGSRDAKIKIWDIEHKMLIHTIDAHWFTVNDLKISADGKVLISSSRDKNIRAWDTETKTPKLFTWKEKHVNSVNSILYDETRQVVISGSDDQTILVQDIRELYT